MWRYGTALYQLRGGRGVYLLQQSLLDGDCFLGGRGTALCGSDMIKQGLGIGVVAVLHNLLHYLRQGMSHGCEPQCRRGTCALHGIAQNDDARLAESLCKLLQQSILTLEEQGRELRVVIIPAPALPVFVTPHEGTVATKASRDGVDAHLVYSVGQHREVFTIEFWVHSSDDI